MTDPRGFGPLQRLVRLWLAPDLPGVVLRRERRTRLLASAVLLAMGLGWGVFFALRGHWGVVLSDVALALCGIGVF